MYFFNNGDATVYPVIRTGNGVERRIWVNGGQGIAPGASHALPIPDDMRFAGQILVFLVKPFGAKLLSPEVDELPAPNANGDIVYRGAAPEEKKPVRPEPVSLPSPDKLGIAPTAPPAPPPPPASGAVDWNATYARMKTMNVLGFGMGRPKEGGYQFSVVMATRTPGETYQIDGVGATEADAVRTCLDKTDRWLKQIP